MKPRSILQTLLTTLLLTSSNCLNLKKSEVTISPRIDCAVMINERNLIDDMKSILLKDKPLETGTKILKTSFDNISEILLLDANYLLEEYISTGKYFE
jgi:hypothetical protein